MSNAIKGIVDTTEKLSGRLNAEGTLSGNLNAARGFDGESAYEIALQNGFEGTEQEWLDSLQGSSGVYLGSGDMPEDCNVQIDPDGDVVTVEQLIEEITTKSATKTADGTVVSQNADFAEVAEWADGNPNNEDRTGYFVCANVPLDGIVMKKATSIDDVKGVTIFAPAFAGNYTKDKVDSNGNLLPKYSYVAIIGFVPVIDNGTCTVGGRCMPDDNGCAVPSSNSMGYQVVNRIDENRVLIIIEPNGDMVQRVKTKINQLQEDVDNCVQKPSTTSGANRIYGIKANSTDTAYYQVQYAPTSQAIPRYYTDKTLRVGTPTKTSNKDSAVNVEYVDAVIDDVNNHAANALKGSVSGSSVTIRDISPVEHNIKCTLSGEGIDLSRVKVQRLGKNLLNAMGLASNNNATDYVQDEANNSFTIRGDEGTLAYLFNTGQLMFPHANNTILAEQGIPVKAGVTYILSFDYLLLEQGKYNEYIRAVVTLGNIETILAQLDAKGVIGTTTRHYLKFMAPTDGKLGLVFRINNNYVKISNIQIEIGATGTEFEPYIEPVEFSVDTSGNVQGNTYLYPSMTLMTDTEGVNISAEYNRDINKAFAALEAAIANL